MKMAFKAIYSSSSIRAQETAQIIHQHLPKLPYFGIKQKKYERELFLNCIIICR